MDCEGNRGVLRQDSWLHEGLKALAARRRLAQPASTTRIASKLATACVIALLSVSAVEGDFSVYTPAGCGGTAIACNTAAASTDFDADGSCSGATTMTISYQP